MIKTYLIITLLDTLYTILAFYIKTGTKECFYNIQDVSLLSNACSQLPETSR